MQKGSPLTTDEAERLSELTGERHEHCAMCFAAISVSMGHIAALRDETGEADGIVFLCDACDRAAL